jgi:hypothetical protein
MNDTSEGSVPLWQPLVFGAMAGGLGWGIRGQYGHETGAMIAGLLVGLVLTLLFRPNAAQLPAARAVAWCTVAMGLGGSMTYGQTVGLTHDPALVGRWAPFAWGMLGLAIKGAIWIGFAGTFLGMGLGGRRYRTGEMLLVMLGLLAVSSLGIWIFNEPYDPARRILPRLYFSADWRWLPEATLKPRREVWGGLLLALVALIAYVHWIRRDPLAPRLGLWAALGGALGFPLGQCVQAWHAWNLDLFQSGWPARIAPNINWWNFMETTFGTTMGATIGLGLWLNRHRIAPLRDEPAPPLPVPVEWGLAVVHVFLLVAVEFSGWPWANTVYDFGLMLGFIPAVALATGRWWPYLVLFPITVIPIAGKTLDNLVFEAHALGVVPGIVLHVGLPLLMTGAAVVVWGRRATQATQARPFLATSLVLATWLYFGLNYAFFRFPWPWAKWTARTPNAIVFTAYALGLTWIAWRTTRRQPVEG